MIGIEDTRRLTQTHLLAVSGGGAGLAALGSLLPWVTMSTGFGTVSIPGTHGDGQITLVLSLVIALGVFDLWRKGPTRRATRIVVGLLGALVAVVGGNAIAGIGDVASSTSSGAVASAGAGLYLVVIGGLAALVGVVMYRPEPQKNDA